jgi:SAM-dependent methyltransferase
MTNTYQDNARAYFESTVHVDPGPFLSPLLRWLTPGARILDVGCGSGRDMLWFRERGFEVTGLERSSALAALAREHSGCPVVEADFLDHDFSQERVQALLLIGALVHLDKDRAAEATSRMLCGLSAPGYLLVSLKQGSGSQKAADGRVFVLWSDPEARAMFAALGLEVLEAFSQTSPVRPQDQWLGYVLGVFRHDPEKEPG